MDSLKNNQKFVLYHGLLLNVLLYSVVLGFFNDYTNLISTKSYSMTFFAAFVLALLVYPTFKLKSYLAKHFKSRNQKIALVLSVWAVMFTSKFLFLWVLGILFGSYLEIYGFLGLIIIIVTATVLQKIVDYFYQRFSNQAP
jgi:hypothetical protein